MADVSLLERAAVRDRILADQRQNVENMQQFEVTGLPQFSEHLENGQFLDYLYPWEKIYLRTNNFEKFYPRTRKTNKFFHNAMQLNDYSMLMSNTSSNNEDRPPPSEELFFDTDDQNAYDHIMQYTRYAPRITLLQSSLLRDLDHYVIYPDDDQHQICKKQHKRLDLIRGYCKELKRKRFAKAFQRFTKVRAKKQSVELEAMELLEREMIDKNLLRYDYYDRNEPSEYKTILLEARKKAITAKYLQYLSDPKYRRMYRDRIYYNVNQDVHLDDRYHMDDSAMLINADEVDNPKINPEIAETFRQSIPARRRHHRKVNMQSLAGVTNKDRFEDGSVPLHANWPTEIPTSEIEFFSDLETLNQNQSSLNAVDKKRHLLEAMDRFRKVKDEVNTLSPSDESEMLAALMIREKNLEKSPTSPMPLYWRNKRIKAIRRKCNRYAQDPDFRHRFAQRMDLSLIDVSQSPNSLNASTRLRGGGNESNEYETEKKRTIKPSLYWSRDKKVVRNKTFEFPHEGGSVNVMLSVDERAYIDDGSNFNIVEVKTKPLRFHEKTGRGILKASESVLYESPTARGMVSITTQHIHDDQPTPVILSADPSFENTNFDGPFQMPNELDKTPFSENTGRNNYRPRQLEYSPLENFEESDQMYANNNAHDISEIPPMNLEEYTPEQPDSDIPTSEAEFMSDFEWKYSPRHARRNRRRLRALERFTSVASLHLETPHEECENLFSQELADKGLAEDTQQDEYTSKLRAKRLRSIQRKYDKYATDENYRQIYKQRVISGAFLAEQFKNIDEVRAGSAMNQTEKPGATSSSIHQDNVSTQSSVDADPIITDGERPTEFEDEEQLTGYDDPTQQSMNTTYNLDAPTILSAIDVLEEYDDPTQTSTLNTTYNLDAPNILSDLDADGPNTIGNEESIFIGNRIIRREQPINPDLKVTKLDATLVDDEEYVAESNDVEMVPDVNIEETTGQTWTIPTVLVTDPEGQEEVYFDQPSGGRSQIWVKASDSPQFVPADKQLQDEMISFWQNSQLPASTPRKQWDALSFQSPTTMTEPSWTQQSMAQASTRKKWDAPLKSPTTLDAPTWTAQPMQPQKISTRKQWEPQATPTHMNAPAWSQKAMIQQPESPNAALKLWTNPKNNANENDDVDATPTATGTDEPSSAMDRYLRQDGAAGASVAVDSEVENVDALGDTTDDPEYREFKKTTNRYHSGLTAYANVSTAESSFDEEVPASELELMSDFNADAIAAAEAMYVKPMSRRKMELFLELIKLEMNSTEDIAERRNCFIRYYHAGNEKRRRKNALNRLYKVMRSDVHPTAEGLRMELEELDNKHLNRAKLYGEDEPKEFTNLLKKRRTAIHRKFTRYGTDEQFRETYRNRVLTGLQDKVDLCATIRNIPIQIGAQSTPMPEA